MDIKEKINELMMKRAQAEALVYKLQGAIEILQEMEEKESKDVKKK